MYALNVPRMVTGLRKHSSLHKVQLFVSRPRRTLERSRNLQTPSGGSLGQRLKLLIAPAIFTGAVGVSTYCLTVDYQQNRRNYRRDRLHKTFPGQNLLTGIVATNVAVFLLWRFARSGRSPALSQFLNKYMVSDVYGKRRVISMVGSTYSHMHPFHILCNMYVLISFINITSDPYSFFHIYTTGGLVACLMSYTRAVLQPHLGIRSIGASGAILSLLGCTFAQFPSAEFAIVFVDQLIPHSFTGQTVFRSVIAFDICGLLFGWRKLDHAAHLGGILYGYMIGMINRNNK